MNRFIRNKATIFCLCTLILVFLFFFRTIFYSLKTYDELLPFNEHYLPTCLSLSEMFELISTLGLNNCFEAANTLYSNIISFRCNPFGNFLQLLIQFLFKKNPVNYHLYSLCLHLINTTFLFLIIDRISLGFSNNKTRLFTVSLITLTWALHPVNLESILLLSNANIVLSYTFCFSAMFLYLSSFKEDFKNYNISILKSVTLFLLYTLGLFTAEFHFILPLILIAYVTAMKTHYEQKSVFSSLIFSIKSALPLILGSFLFMLTFLLSVTRTNIYSGSLELTLERIFWFSPQILFHFFKLTFLPIKLSIDQSFFVILGKSLFDPYAIFCILFILFILILCTRSLINGKNAKKHFPFFFVSFFPFLLSLLPFSQVIAPAYNLASERYLYFPSFILIIGLSHFVFFSFSRISSRDAVNRVSTTFIILFLLIVLGIRSYTRTLDWKDSISFYKSVIRETENPLYKAFRYKVLTPQEKIFAEYPEKVVETKYKKLAIKNALKAIQILNSEREKYQSKVPNIIKNYGLDPETFIAKAGYLLAQTNFNLNEDPKQALRIMQKYIKDPSLLSIDALVFYSSVYFHNDMVDKAEEILKIAYEKDPYSLRVIFVTADLANIKSGNLKEIEKYAQTAFKYFPYDTKTLSLLTKLYYARGNFEKYAYFSYIYGLRCHSIQDLSNAYNIYLSLNKKDMAEKVKKEMDFLEKVFYGSRI